MKKVFALVKRPKTREETEAREYHGKYLKSKYLIFTYIDTEK